MQQVFAVAVCPNCQASSSLFSTSYYYYAGLGGEAPCQVCGRPGREWQFYAVPGNEFAPTPEQVLASIQHRDEDVILYLGGIIMFRRGGERYVIIRDVPHQKRKMSFFITAGKVTTASMSIPPQSRLGKAMREVWHLSTHQKWWRYKVLKVLSPEAELRVTYEWFFGERYFSGGSVTRNFVIRGDEAEEVKE